MKLILLHLFIFYLFKFIFRGSPCGMWNLPILGFELIPPENSLLLYLLILVFYR